MNDRNKQAGAWIVALGIVAYGALLAAAIMPALLSEPQPEPSPTSGYEAKP